MSAAVNAGGATYLTTFDGGGESMEMSLIGNDDKKGDRNATTGNLR